MDLKQFALSVSQIAEEKGIPKEKVIETIEQAIAAAYKKDYGKRNQIIRAKLDTKTGKVRFWRVKLVVDKNMIYSEDELEKLKQTKEKKDSLSSDSKPSKIRFNPERHIMLEDAKKIDPEIKAGEELKTELETEESYGRIAAQTAKQVIIQRIREIEREILFNDFKSKEGEIVSGIVQRAEGGNVYLDIGKTLGILPKEEQIRGEFYRTGQRFKVYVLTVEKTPRGPVVFLSRAYPKLVSKLFELEVPEISSGQVVIKSIAREAGSRSKIAVASTFEGVDPIGSMVGQRGTRVTAVINELGGEKIDIVEWSEDPEKFISNSLSPAKVLEVKIGEKNKATAIVPEDQLSLAIGKNGQNVRLAAKLTGWKIDVKSSSEKEDGKVIDESNNKEDGTEQGVNVVGTEENKTDEKNGEKVKGEDLGGVKPEKSPEN